MEKYKFNECKINFEFHLDEDSVKDVERIDENVRIIRMDNINTEFGIETDKDKVNIEFGFGVLELRKEDLKKAYNNWVKRDKILYKKNGKISKKIKRV